MENKLHDKEVLTGDSSINKIFDKQKAKSLLLRESGLKDRIKKIRKIKKWILENTDKIHEALHKDLKKPITETDLTEIRIVLSEIRHAISNLSEWMRPKEAPTPLALLGTRSYIYIEPKGVCLIISPWNFPFNLTLCPLVHALAAGNTAIIKPSEMTPATSRLVSEMISGLFNEDEVKVFEGNEEVAKMLLDLPFDHIFFTGSPKVGKIVMKAAANHLSSITLELGGKSPAIIEKSANFKDAAEKITWGKFLNNGQTCIAPDYVLVPKSAKNEFVQHSIKYIKEKFSKNNEFESAEAYGRIINIKHLERLIALMEDSKEKGGIVEMGGSYIKDDLFFEPTIITGLNENCRLMEEEIFGPILPVVTYENITEVINLINDKPKPLALYVFGKDKKKIEDIFNKTSSGSACINDCLIQFTHPGLPFGGVNNSGIGKSHGYHGFLAFSNEKPILKQKKGLTTLQFLYPPYKPWVKKISSIISKHF